MRTLALVLCALSACSSKSAEPTAEPDSRIEELAEEACACTDLGCMAKRQRILENMLEATHTSQMATDVRDAVKARVAACTQKLALALKADIGALADDLCACADRACYEALLPRVDRIFSPSNAADIGPAMLAEIRAETERFNRCDAKFAPPSP